MRVSVIEKITSLLKTGKKEKSPGGSDMLKYTYQENSNNFRLERNEGISHFVLDHITKFLGSPTSIYHGSTTPYSDLDIYIIEPSKKYNFKILITNGMSSKPMNVPKGKEGYSYCELLLCLPPDWDLSDIGCKDENKYWPLRWLGILACFPHEYNTWLSRGHITHAGEKPESLALNIGFTSMYITLPKLFPESFVSAKMKDGKTIWFYSVIPIYSSEKDYKLRKGSVALENLFNSNNISECLNPIRKPVVQ
jgi:hypothetical protein